MSRLLSGPPALAVEPSGDALLQQAGRLACEEKVILLSYITTTTTTTTTNNNNNI